MPAAPSVAGRDSDRSVHKLLEEWQARAARGEQLNPEAMLAELSEATNGGQPDLPQTVELPGIHQAGTVSVRPPSNAAPAAAADPSPSAAFERLSSRLKALTAAASDGEPAKDGLADYELLREVARGGMGVVYEARQKSLNRIVALKMIKAGELADAEDVARFYSEAEAAANLRHPNIVAVYEVGRAGPGGEQHYFTMDFIAGPSLLELIRKQPLDGPSAAQYLAKIARAIQFAHDRGVLHRDLKPSNILIGEGGQPLVTDFGLAKRIDHDSQLTIAGTVIGTPSYMPPEQAAGNLRQVGPHSDVYSLGAVLYECVTGRPPFVAANIMDVFQQVIQEEPVPPSKLSPKLPRDLETICVKCLEKDRQRRYASAGALADDLDRFLKGEPIAARPVGPIERLVKWARRRPAMAALYGVLGLAVLSVLGISGFYNHELSQSNQQLSTTVSKLDTALKDANTQRKAERRNNYATVIQRAEDYWQESPPNIARARELLAGLMPHEGDEDLRGVEWHVLTRMCNTDDQQILTGAGAIKELAVLPSGRALSFRDVSMNPFLEWVDPDGERGRIAIRTDPRPLVMRFSTQSDWMVTRSQGGQVELRSRLTPERVEAAVRTQGDELAEVAISRDGRRLAWCTWPGRFGVWNVAERKHEWEGQLSDVSVRQIEFSPDGNWLALRTLKVVFLANLQTRQNPRPLAPTCPANLSAMTFAADSQSLAVAYNDGEIATYKVADRRVLARFNTLKLSVRPECLEFLPDGKYLAVGASNGLVIVMSVPEGKSRKFRGHTESINCLAASPDGKWLYSGSNRGEVLRWDPAQVDQRATLIDGARNGDDTLCYQCLDYSPDGRWLAIGGRWLSFDVAPPDRGELAIVDSATREIVKRIDTPAGIVACRFTPDSRQLVYGSARSLAPGRFWLTSVAELDQPREIVLEGEQLFAAAPLADGNVALASSDAILRVWSPKTSGQVGQWRPNASRLRTTQMFNLVGSTGGKHLLGHGESGLVRLWDAQAGRDLLMAPCSLNYEPLAVSADGRLIVFPAANPELIRAVEADGLAVTPGITAFSDWEGKAIVYDVQQRQVRLVVSGHLSGLRALAFSADSRRLATADGRGYLRLWDTETGYELLSLEAHLNDVFGVAFHPSGKQIATVGADAVVRIWPQK